MRTLNLFSTWALGAAFFYSACCSWTQDAAVEAKMAEGFEPFLQDLMKDKDVPGVVISVVRNDAVVYAKAFGVKNSESGETTTTGLSSSIDGI